MIIGLVKDLSRNRKETMIIVDHSHTHRLAVVQLGTVTFDKPVKDTSIEELTVNGVFVPCAQPDRPKGAAGELNI
jgi:hypothetical protein